jgi:hypothetical protein
MPGKARQGKAMHISKASHVGKKRLLCKDTCLGKARHLFMASHLGKSRQGT